jgi:hypothetical protein
MDEMTEEQILLKDIYVFIGEMTRSDFGNDEIYGKVADKIYNPLNEYFMKLWKKKE